MAESSPARPANAAAERVLRLLSATKRARAPRLLVCGAQGTGKSTLCRALCDALSRSRGSVALLDTDLGQNELMPPGFVSLHLLDGPHFGDAAPHAQFQRFGVTGVINGRCPALLMQALAEDLLPDLRC